MWLALLALGFVWGSSFILMKMALFDTAGGRLFPALDVALGRIAIAGLAMAPLAWTHRAHLTRQNLPWLLIVGGLGNMLPAYFFTTAQTLIPSSVAGMLNALTPMFTLIVGVMLFEVESMPFRWPALPSGWWGLPCWLSNRAWATHWVRKPWVGQDGCSRPQHATGSA